MIAPGADRSVTPRRSPHVAAFLSFLWPGLGHAYTRRWRPAALFGIPIVIVWLIFLAQLAGGIENLAVVLFTPSSALTIAILVLLIGLWRLVAIADSMIGFGIHSPWRRGPTAATFAGLAVVVLVTHVTLGYVAWAFYDAGSRIFTAENSPDNTPSPPPGSTPNASDELAATPLATPETANSRINILLLGVDSAEEREHSLTDTLMVVSIDPVTNDVAMISFPRDISNFPMPDGRIFTGKINSLMTAARNHPDQYPDGPLPTVISELGYLLGVPIHYYAAIDLDGFRRMIDLVGGVTIDNPKAINDPRYDWLDSDKHGFYLSAGKHTLDGKTALAYVRSRQGAGDNDFNRARRQQQVLVALRGKLTSPEMLPKLTDILAAAGDSIRTNFPSDRVGEMVTIAQKVDDSKIFRVVLGPSKYATHPPNNTTNGVYTLKLKMDALAELSIKIFGDQSAYLKGAVLPAAQP